MEMPESCYYCPLMYGSWGYSPPHKARCVITGKDMPIDERGVQHNQSCPIVPVPPHGRLGDLDALKAKAIERSEKRGEMVNVLDPVINAYDIATAPTIIPAEEAQP